MWKGLAAVTSGRIFRSVSGARVFKTEYAPVMELVDMRDLGSVISVKLKVTPLFGEEDCYEIYADL